MAMFVYYNSETPVCLLSDVGGSFVTFRPLATPHFNCSFVCLKLFSRECVGTFSVLKKKPFWKKDLGGGESADQMQPLRVQEWGR